MIAAALASAAALVAPAPRVRGAGALLATALALALLVDDLARSDRLDSLTGRPAALAVNAAVLLVAAAVLVARHPAVLAVAAVAALPFRVPLGVDGDTVNLLVPLYGVIGAGLLASAARELRGQATRRKPRALEWLLVASITLYAVQSAYSGDVDKALEQIVFFYVPFALLFKLLAELEWTPRLIRACLVTTVGLALAFCALGFFQYATGTVWLNEKLLNANTYTTYFRVNSLFFDPNVYGRYLILAMMAVTAVALWDHHARAAAAVLAVLWLGLLTTRSESSMVALVVGVAILALLRGDPGRLVRRGAVALAAVAAVGIAVALLTGNASLRKATSGRSALVEGGAELFAERPLQGWGSGAFSLEYERQDVAPGTVSASHTVPVTVAAEQGVIGLVVYVALLVAAFGRLFRPRVASAARAAIAAAFAALWVHTLLYAAFLEDPITWALLAAGTALSQTSSSATSESPTSM
jgi:O-antigen ligase